jgi:cytochrome P450
MMWSKSQLLVKALREEATRPDPDAQRGGHGVVELSDWASKVTLDIIGIAGLGRQLNVVEKKDDPLTSIYVQLLNPAKEMIIFAAACFGLGYERVKLLPWKMNTFFADLATSLDEICMKMVQDKREAILKKGDDHFDILSLLIKSDNFSDTDLKDQLLTFLAAG